MLVLPTSGRGTQTEGSVAADVTMLPQDVAEHYPGDGDELQAVDAAQVAADLRVEDLDGVGVGREPLQHCQVVLR